MRVDAETHTSRIHKSPKLRQVDLFEGKSSGAKLMRPKKSVADELTTCLKKDESQSKMRSMHRDKTTQMYKECFAEHASLNDSQLCAVPRFTVHTEVKGCLCWKQNLRCIKCGYT